MPEIKHQKKKRTMLTPQGWWDSPIAGKVHFQSSYERKFCRFLDEKKLNWRKNKERFPYISPFDGKTHNYVPDFVIVDEQECPVLYIEVKGMVRKADPAKFEAFPRDKKLVLLGYDELKNHLGLDVKDPMEYFRNPDGTEKKLDPNKWPYKLLQNMPDFQEKGELTEELKSRLDPRQFYAIWDTNKKFS